MYKLDRIAKRLALASFEIGAIKIQPHNPFEWAKGWKSPVYNDNRLFLFHPEYRGLVIRGFDVLLDNLPMYVEIIAGTATAGIPHGALLAENLGLPFIYIRNKPKDHGMKNQIEGIPADKDLDYQEVVVIEDLISTGGSSVAAVDAVRRAKGEVNCCLSIFSYGFPKATAMFEGKIAYKNESFLSTPCSTASIVTYPLLLEVGIEHGYIKKEHVGVLESWSADPEKWSNGWKAAHPE